MKKVIFTTTEKVIENSTGKVLNIKIVDMTSEDDGRNKLWGNLERRVADLLKIDVDVVWDGIKGLLVKKSEHSIKVLYENGNTYEYNVTAHDIEI